MTSPCNTSPFAAILASFIATATDAAAPSPSDTNPIISGRAPMPPRRPITPSVGASPPRDLPFEPGITTLTKSVEPRGPSILVELAFSAPSAFTAATTSFPLTVALSRSENASRVALKLMFSTPSRRRIVLSLCRLPVLPGGKAPDPSRRRRGSACADRLSPRIHSGPPLSQPMTLDSRWTRLSS
ncbi:MAG: hypothetical protein BWY85_01033 [Firmicutes bacterium ADurb.Bin506]|nr:MAG: hypothetical protein BWY85_01033 [Firmicutes bacterium ADurb.Bin506]